MSQYRKTIYYNTGRKPLFRPGLPPGRRRKMINGKRRRDIDKIEALSLLNDVAPFSKFLLGIINFYPILKRNR